MFECWYKRKRNNAHADFHASFLRGEEKNKNHIWFQTKLIFSAFRDATCFISLSFSHIFNVFCVCFVRIVKFYKNCLTEKTISWNCYVIFHSRKRRRLENRKKGSSALSGELKISGVVTQSGNWITIFIKSYFNCKAVVLNWWETVGKNWTKLLNIEKETFVIFELILSSTMSAYYSCLKPSVRAALKVHQF